MEYNKTTQVIIPISEYNELLDIKQRFVKAFDEKAILMRYRTWSAGPGGQLMEFNLVNSTDVIEELNKKLKQVEDSYNILYKENWTLWVYCRG